VVLTCILVFCTIHVSLPTNHRGRDLSPAKLGLTGGHKDPLKWCCLKPRTAKYCIMAQAPNDATAALLQALTQLTDNLKNKHDDGFSGFKANLKHVPVLEDEMEWSEWIIKTKTPSG
jgi:hypothetical protein